MQVPHASMELIIWSNALRPAMLVDATHWRCFAGFLRIALKRARSNVKVSSVDMFGGTDAAPSAATVVVAIVAEATCEKVRACNHATILNGERIEFPYLLS